MSNNIEFKFIKEKIEDLKKEIPNIEVPTMGIIDDKTDIEIDNKDYLNSETEEEN